MQDKILTPFNKYIQQNHGRDFPGQNPKVIWITGLSGAGKTTLAMALDKGIRKNGYFTIVIDGDLIREGINKDLGFSDADRMENIRRTAEIAKLFANHGLIVICSFIAPLKSMRDIACSIVGKSRFIEVFVNCPVEICEQRDIKGLYKKARKGLIKDFTGVTSPYEIPENPDIEIHTDILDIKKSVDYLLNDILPRIRYNTPK